MRVLCAPNSFKETISAADVAQAMARGVLRADARIDCDRCPIGDGGEGTMEALAESLGAAYHSLTVIGPLGEPVTARFSMNAERSLGIVELAPASGLALVPRSKRDPMRSTTFGTGQ